MTRLAKAVVAAFLLSLVYRKDDESAEDDTQATVEQPVNAIRQATAEHLAAEQGYAFVQRPRPIVVPDTFPKDWTS